MNDQVVRFAVITFSGIIGIAVAQLVFQGGLDPVRLLALAGFMAAVALVTVSVRRAFERPTVSKPQPKPAQPNGLPSRPRTGL